MGKINVGLVGEANVGKTCVINRFINKQFDETHNLEKPIKPFVSNGVTYDLVLYDFDSDLTNEQRCEIYSKIDVLILCFDLSNKCTYETIKRIWIKEFRQHAKHCRILLIGTKSDLLRQVKNEKINRIVKRLDAFKFIECSSMQNYNINDIFDYVIKCYHSDKQPKLKKKRRICNKLKFWKKNKLYFND